MADKKSGSNPFIQQQERKSAYLEEMYWKLLDEKLKEKEFMRKQQGEKAKMDYQARQKQREKQWDMQQEMSRDRKDNPQKYVIQELYKQQVQRKKEPLQYGRDYLSGPHEDPSGGGKINPPGVRPTTPTGESRDYYLSGQNISSKAVSVRQQYLDRLNRIQSDHEQGKGKPLTPKSQALRKKLMKEELDLPSKVNTATEAVLSNLAVGMEDGTINSMEDALARVEQNKALLEENNVDVDFVTRMIQNEAALGNKAFKSPQQKSGAGKLLQEILDWIKE